MKQFKVILEETFAIEVIVNADSVAEAYNKAYDMYWDGEIEAAQALPDAKFIEGNFIDCNEVE